MVAAPKTTKEKTRKTSQKKKTQKTLKNPQILKSCCSGSFRIFVEFQNSTRFVYGGVVLRFSQKHTCLEQSESLFGLFDHV